MHLPRIDGLEAFAIVRQIRGGVPAILITADQDEDLLRRALTAHVFCVLSKPVSPRLAMHTVQRAIQKYY
jgi:CheY-like chemotaxis protein